MAYHSELKTTDVLKNDSIIYIYIFIQDLAALDIFMIWIVHLTPLYESMINCDLARPAVHCRGHLVKTIYIYICVCVLKHISFVERKYVLFLKYGKYYYTFGHHCTLNKIPYLAHQKVVDRICTIVYLSTFYFSFIKRCVNHNMHMDPPPKTAPPVSTLSRLFVDSLNYVCVNAFGVHVEDREE